MDKFENYVPHKNLLAQLEKDGFMYSTPFGSKIKVAENCDEALDAIKHIPAENINKVICNYRLLYSLLERRGALTLGALLNKAAERGFLAFKPYVINDGRRHPILVLKYNRYLHLFRGYNFQVSYTAEGIGEYSSAGIRLDFALKNFNYDACNSKYVQMLYYMNAVHAAIELETFRVLLHDDVGIFDDFMKATLEHVYMKSLKVNYTFNDVCSMLRRLPANSDASENAVSIYRIPDTDTMDYARLYMYSNDMLAIETPNEGGTNTALFKLPELKDDEHLVSEFPYKYEEDLEEIAEEVKDNKEIFYSFVAFTLDLCGIHSNFMVTYPLERPATKFRALNRPLIEEVDKLSDIVQVA